MNAAYTLVVRRKSLGRRWRVYLISNYKRGIEEIVLQSQGYYSKSNAIRQADSLSVMLNCSIEVEG